MNHAIKQRISLLSFFMTCVIVIYHCGFQSIDAASEASGINIAFSGALDSLALMAMSYFFAITGFLLFFSLDFKNYSAKIRRRVSSLLIPYLLWQAIVVAEQLLIGARFSPGDLLMRVFLLSSYPPNGALWYVYVVFLLALLSPILLVLMKDHRCGTISIICLYILSFAGLSSENDLVMNILSNGNMRQILSYLPAYLIGAYCGHAFAKADTDKPYAGCLLVALTAYMLNVALDGFFAFTITSMLPIALIMLLPINPEKEHTCHFTFLIYAIHQPVLQVIKKRIFSLIARYIQNELFANFLCVGICLALIILGAYMLYHVLNRLTPTTLSLLTGGRAVSKKAKIPNKTKKHSRTCPGSAVFFAVLSLDLPEIA